MNSKLFVPAGIFCYWNAWLFRGLLFTSMLIAEIIRMFKNFSLLKRRLDEKEKVLTKELDGCSKYKDKVKYRLIPFIW